MEHDIIHKLLLERPPWLQAFPVVVCMEYGIRIPPGCRGRGDLLLANLSHTRLLAVELKRHTKKNAYLLAQMHRYRQAVKMRHPGVPVDGAAVAGGHLLTYIPDEQFRPYRPRVRPCRLRRPPDPMSPVWAWRQPGCGGSTSASSARSASRETASPTASCKRAAGGTG